MWDRHMNPEDLAHFMRAVATEVTEMRREMNDVLRELRQAQFVRERLHRDMPGYWEDAVRLGTVKKRLGDAL